MTAPISNTSSGNTASCDSNDKIIARSKLLERRMTMPQSLEDPDDCTISNSNDDDFFHDNNSVDSHDNKRLLSTSNNFSTSTVAADSTTSSPFPHMSIDLREHFLKYPKEVRNILAGGIAGMVAKSFVAPVDRLKILYQISSTEFQWRVVPTVVRNIVANEGFSALWKGNFATMIRVFPYSGIQFMVYDRCKTHLLKQHQRQEHEQHQTFISSQNKTNNSKDNNNHNNHRTSTKYGLTSAESLVAGMLAGTLSVICTYPLDLTRAQLAVLKKHKHVKNIGFLGVLKSNYTHRGFVGLFRGVGPTLMGILPYSGIAFALNEQGKREIQHITQRDLKTTERMQCGALSGLVAQSITYPIEVTRRRMQTIGLVGNDTALTSLGDGAIKSVLAKKPPSMISIMRDLHQEQGLRGFFKGVSMNWVKGPIAFSISFTVFDTVQALIESDAERALRLPRRVTIKEQQQISKQER